MNRRTAIGVGAASLLGGSALARAGKEAPAKPTTFVLVHGAWHGGWCWRDVRTLLEAQGHRVFTPTLTGLGERSHLREPVPNLSVHIQDVVNTIAFEELDRLVLCGHSYGGMVITGVVDRLKEKISHVVYLDAALPSDGQTMFSQNPNSKPLDDPATQAAIKFLAPDGVWMNVASTELLGIPKTDVEATAWVARRLTPHPLPSWTEPLRLERGGSDGLARTYVLCTNPILPQSAFPLHAARVKNDPTWHYAEITTGHDAMVTAPENVAAILLAAV